MVVRWIESVPLGTSYETVAKRIWALAETAGASEIWMDGTGVGVAVEEMLRWDPPLHLFERWVLEEGVVIAGQPIDVGQEVAMLFGAAQRDPRRFPKPDRFDIARGDVAHIGFGGGIHFCVGAPLARQEIEVSVAGLAARFPSLEVVEEPTYEPNFVIRGLTALHVKG